MYLVKLNFCFYYGGSQLLGIGVRFCTERVLEAKACQFLYGLPLSKILWYRVPVTFIREGVYAFFLVDPYSIAREVLQERSFEKLLEKTDEIARYAIAAMVSFLLSTLTQYSLGISLPLFETVCIEATCPIIIALFQNSVGAFF